MRIHYVFPKDRSGEAWGSGHVEFEPVVLSPADTEACFELGGPNGQVYDGFVHGGRTWIRVDGSDPFSKPGVDFVGPWSAPEEGPRLPVPGWSTLCMRTGLLKASPDDDHRSDARDRARSVAEAVALEIAIVGDDLYTGSYDMMAGAGRRGSKRLRPMPLDANGLWRHPYVFRRVSSSMPGAPFLALRTVAEDPDLAARLFGTDADVLRPDVAEVFRSTEPRAPVADATCYAAALAMLEECRILREFRGSRFEADARTATARLRSLVRVYEDWTLDVPDPADVADALRAVRQGFLDEGTAYGNHAAHALSRDAERFRIWWDERGHAAAHGSSDAADASAFEELLP